MALKSARRKGEAIINPFTLLLGTLVQLMEQLMATTAADVLIEGLFDWGYGVEGKFTNYGGRYK